MNRTTLTWTAGLMVLSTAQIGCDPGQGGSDLARQAQDVCDIGCSDDGIAEGNASITGVKALDGFFAAVIRFDQKAGQVSAGIDAELVALAADFGVDATKLQASFN